MSRVPLHTGDTAPADAAGVLAQIHGAFGATPNMFRAVANSPPALRSLWGSFAALANGSLPAKLTEQIAVAIADRNGCEYCLAAHTALGARAGASRNELARAQSGHSDEPGTAAVLRFALAVVENRGAVSDAEIAAVRAAGFGDREIVEILAHVALNLYTNYVNIALATPLDFPEVKLHRAA